MFARREQSVHGFQQALLPSYQCTIETRLEDFLTAPPPARN
jgi:hypothetical protein